jgi:hypothetical protein
MVIMKNKKTAFTFIMLCAMAFAGCQKGDGGADYGYARIYIPQARVTGLNNHYTVPGGSGDISSLRYTVADGRVDILLSVARSGKISDATGFSVDVAVSADDTRAAMEATGPDAIANAVELPAALYELSPTATVASGETSGPIDLSLDMRQLPGGDYDGKNLVLAVKIANPTAWELSDTNTSVVVIVDVDALREATE